jgi:hypothetical protein
VWAFSFLIFNRFLAKVIFMILISYIRHRLIALIIAFGALWSPIIILAQLDCSYENVVGKSISRQYAKQCLTRGIEQGSSPEDFTLLCIAAYLGDEAALKTLIDRKASLDSNDERFSPLHWAVVSGTLSTADTLINAGANINQKGSHDSYWLETPLNLAIAFHQTPIALLLIQRGALVDEQNKYEQSALHWAAIENDIETLRALALAGADLSLKSNNGWTALDLAKFSKKPEIAQLLIEHTVGKKLNYCQEILDELRAQQAPFNSVLYLSRYYYSNVNESHSLQHCSAVLLDARVILTAAHCLMTEEGEGIHSLAFPVTLFSPISKNSVRADSCCFFTRTGEVHHKALNEPNFLEGSKNDYLDIAVCLLVSSIDEDPSHFAQLESDAAIRDILEHTKYAKLIPSYVVGFSKEGYYANSYDQEIPAGFVNNKVDKDLDTPMLLPTADATNKLYPALLAVGHALQVHQGDSGGGLFQPCQQQSGRWCLVGITALFVFYETNTFVCVNGFSYKAMPLAPLIREMIEKARTNTQLHPIVPIANRLEIVDVTLLHRACLAHDIEAIRALSASDPQALNDLTPNGFSAWALFVLKPKNFSINGNRSFPSTPSGRYYYERLTKFGEGVEEMMALFKHSEYYNEHELLYIIEILFIRKQFKLIERLLMYCPKNHRFNVKLFKAALETNEDAALELIFKWLIQINRLDMFMNWATLSSPELRCKLLDNESFMNLATPEQMVKWHNNVPSGYIGCPPCELSL